MRPERRSDNTQSHAMVEPTPIGREFCRIVDKWRRQFGDRPMPEAVQEGAWDKAGFYKAHPELKVPRKPKVLPLP